MAMVKKSKTSIEEIRKKALEETKRKLKKELVSRDNLIVQAVKTIDNIDKTSNLLIEQLKEWYSLYFPELARIVADTDQYLDLMVNLKTKENFTSVKVEKIVEENLATKIPNAAKNSVGADFPKQDVEEIAAFGKQILETRKERRHIEEYLEKLMQEEAPNITAITGAILGARLIATAGSLKKLSEFPSSTIQVLGAEKALFAHLRKGVPAPKHGIIFAFPKLRSAPKKLRGKIARRISSKISIATKLDYFKGEFKGDELAEKLGKEIEKLLAIK